MIQAQILRGQGLKQKEIAEILGVSDRTVRNHLKESPCRRKTRKYKSKLDPHRDFIKGLIEEQPGYNCVLLYERLVKTGYTGGMSILRDYVNQVRKKVITEAVIRFETEPGFQAQVDWVEIGRYLVNGSLQKIYGFVMTLGYSRKSFVCFTTSMKQSILHACHELAFEYFGGVPKEILYDNMKTAFLSDSEGKFYPNRKLLAFAHHYGFTPRRCKVRRPQTKGKVERFIGYIGENFLPRIESKEICLDSLNEEVLKWLNYVDAKPISGLNESRSERFDREKEHLTAIPVHRFDSREVYECCVNRESMISFESNRYSVPPAYIGEIITLKADLLRSEGEIFFESKSIRKFHLEASGQRKKIFFPEDKQEIRQLWEKQKDRREQRERARTLREKKIHEVDVRSPAAYEAFTGAAS